MDIYLVVLEDRHIDVQIEAYTNRDVAITRAQEIEEDYDLDGVDQYPYLGAEYNKNLSCESDIVYVLKRELKA